MIDFMKKSIYYLALLTLVTLASCTNSEDVSIQSFPIYTNCRTVENNDVVFHRNSGVIEFNNTENTVQFTGEFKDMDGRKLTFKTSEMKMNAASSTADVYSFSANTINGSAVITGLKGYVDLGTGLLWCSFQVDGSMTVYCTTDLIFPYSTTTITDENGNNYKNEGSDYLLAFDTDGDKAIMRISDFIPAVNGTIAARIIEYKGIKMTPTTTGYIFTADELQSNASGSYDITDLNITVDRQGQHMSGTFKCNGNNFTVDGDAWHLSSAL